MVLKMRDIYPQVINMGNYPLNSTILKMFKESDFSIYNHGSQKKIKIKTQRTIGSLLILS
jgi:hypothetical protein